MTAEFAEKQYENGANIELARVGGQVFSPGQIEESILGYDVAARPGQDAVRVLRQIAGISIEPAIWLTPNWWLRCPRRPHPSALADRFASLLLQYKRPELVTSPAASLFDRHQGAYFRYALRKKQHEILVRLNEALNDAAVVRYAAPCTVGQLQLVQWQIDGALLQNSNFVAPRRIGLRHSSWTYKLPGSLGYRNEYSEGDEAIPSETFEDVLGLLFSGSEDGPALAQHLELLSVLINGEETDARAREAVSTIAARNLNSEVLAAVRMWLIGLTLREAQTTWWLIAR